MRSGTEVLTVAQLPVERARLSLDGDAHRFVQHAADDDELAIDPVDQEMSGPRTAGRLYLVQASRSAIRSWTSASTPAQNAFSSASSLIST